MTRTAFAWPLLLLMLAGCARPERDVAAYRAILEARVPPATLPDDGTLSLQDALGLANRYNESLDLQGELLVRAVVERRRSVAEFLPTVGLAPELSVADAPAGYDTDFDVPITLDWTLFDLGRADRYWRDVYLIERQRERLLEAQELLLLDVANVYYAVLRAEAQVRVLENSLAVQDERLRDTRGRAEAGFARPLDVAQTEAQTAATRVQLIEARRLVGDARSLLAFLVHAPVEALELIDGLTLAPPAEVDALLATAALHRSELRAADRAVAAARRDVEAAVAQYYPSVTLGFDLFLYRQSAPDDRAWTGVLQASLPLFAAGRIEADVREAWSFLREAILIESQSARRVRREIEQTLRDLAASIERAQQLEISLAAAQDAFRQAEASYAAGLATNLERVTAQDALLAAELASATERIDQQALRVRLLAVVGTLRETLLETSATSD